jgi:formamidopyrimidine-DNA glycosylase
MPELPEVETTCRGIRPHLLGQQVSKVIVRNPRLRWPIPPQLADELPGQRIQRVERRAKYLLLGSGEHTLILHLGMSGNLRIVRADTPAGKHDHLDLVLADGNCLRLQDPRRFGAALWVKGNPNHHPLLKTLGPEPLSEDFNGAQLHALAHHRRVAIKRFIMNNHHVVGVGNIYANEALFHSGIHPARAAGRISRKRFDSLATTIKKVLHAAIQQGGTTLRDFVDSDGKPGYFSQQLAVYGRDGEPCPNCNNPVHRLTLGQRGTFFCPRCQR